jgi:hypothetical protein
VDELEEEAKCVRTRESAKGAFRSDRSGRIVRLAWTFIKFSSEEGRQDGVCRKGISGHVKYKVRVLKSK